MSELNSCWIRVQYLWGGSDHRSQKAPNKNAFGGLFFLMPVPIPHPPILFFSAHWFPTLWNNWVSLSCSPPSPHPTLIQTLTRSLHPFFTSSVRTASLHTLQRSTRRCAPYTWADETASQPSTIDICLFPPLIWSDYFYRIRIHKNNSFGPFLGTHTGSQLFVTLILNYLSGLSTSL